MTNLITKVMHNGTQYDIWGVTSVNWQTGAVTIPEWITKIFTLSSSSDLTTAQQAYDWCANWGNPILIYGNAVYTVNRKFGSVSDLVFSEIDDNIADSNRIMYLRTINLIATNGVVNSITQWEKAIWLSTTVPTSGGNNIITLVI